MFEALPQDWLFYVAGFAGLFALLVHYLYYESFIKENYDKLKWFRRMVLPHISFLLRQIGEQTGNDQFSRLYVETPIRDGEKAITFEVPENTHHEYVVDKVQSVLTDAHYRREVLLASLKQGDNEMEVGNYVLTGPNRWRPENRAMNPLYSVFLMLTSKYQLHVRLIYNTEEDNVYLLAHHEYNPYNPIFAKSHLEGKEFNVNKGVNMFLEQSWEELKDEMPDDVEFYKYYV